MTDPVGGLTRPIVISRNAWEVDSFAACVHAALLSWGRDVAYDCVAALAGSAFSPGFRPNESCASRWTEPGNDERIEFMGHALGFTVDYAPEARLGGRAAFAERACEAIAGGDVVLCGSRPCWSIVTRWHEDPLQRSLAAPAGLAHRCAAAEDSVYYIIRPGDRILTRCEAIREALRFGASVAAGTHDLDGIAFGSELYDEWLNRLNGECFCAGCDDGGWQCAEWTASRVRAGQLAATRFLTRAQDALLDHLAEPDLRDAAGAYAGMAQILADYGMGSGIERIWGNGARLGQYGHDLQSVHDLHLKAAEHMQLAACRL